LRYGSVPWRLLIRDSEQTEIAKALFHSHNDNNPNTMNNITNQDIMKWVIILLIWVFPCTFIITAQEHHERVLVVKSFNPMVDDAFKININPVITDTVRRGERSVSYEITPIKLNTDIEVMPIQAARMRGGLQQSELYRFFLKSGFGNYTTPYFELFYNSLRSRTGNHGLHYRHLSSHGTIDGYAFPGYSENGIDGYTTHFGRKHTFSLKGMYDRDVVHFYGRQDTLSNDTIGKDLIRQRFHRAGMNASMESVGGFGNKPEYGTGLRYRMINDLYETTEHAVYFNGKLQKDVEWFSFSRYQIAGVRVSGDYYNTGMGIDTMKQMHNQLLVRINPYLTARMNDMEATAGVVAGYESAGNGNLVLFPDISVKITLKEHKFLIMGGLEGGISRSSFFSLSETNPFIISDPEIRNTITRVRAYGGLRTAIGPRINFTARVATESVRNMALFTPDTLFPIHNRFSVLYDDGSVLTLKGELNYQMTEKFKVSGKVIYRDFNMQNETFAWHEPALTAGLEMRYNLENKILAYAGLSYLNGIKVQAFQEGLEVAENLPDIFDINLGAEYRYSKLLSGFVRLNNLAASRYYRWQHYPTQRFNFMLGITYAL
jgi:hypothetical protein